MSRNYTARERRELADALRRGAALHCPACGAPLARREVSAPPALPYVRRRVWLICTACKRSAAVDVGEEG